MEWFRRKTWTDQDRDEFHAHLDRSRGQFRKAQYARIQAYELFREPSESNLKGAMELLRFVLEQYPDEFELGQVFHQLGECHEYLGNHEEALTNYRKALQQQRVFPNVRTNVHLTFALLVAELRLRNDYDDALAVLDEFGRRESFPIGEFRSCAARALIHSDLSEKVKADDWARRALAAAEKTQSDFRYHRKLGLVGEQESDRVQKMRDILAS